MNRELAEAVVRCLSFSGEPCEVDTLSRFRLPDWQRTFKWLDTSGLTLYLLRRLKCLGATGFQHRKLVQIGDGPHEGLGITPADFNSDGLLDFIIQDPGQVVVVIQK